VVIATSSTDASATVPVEPLGSFPSTKFGSWWIIGVSGQPAYINVGAAATTSNISFPIGVYMEPLWFPPGTVLHAITAAGSGQVWLVRCYLANI